MEKSLVFKEQKSDFVNQLQQSHTGILFNVPAEEQLKKGFVKGDL